MTKRRSFTDEDLTAYLDGEAEAGLRADIAGALKRDSTLQKRMDALTFDITALGSAFDALLPSAPDAPSFGASVQAIGSSPWMRYRALAATAALCVAVGWGGAAYVSRPVPETWREFAATYHALYVTTTLSEFGINPTALATELKRVSTSVGKPVQIETLSQIADLDLKRVQILGFEGRPLMQVAFLSKVGAPVALCIMKARQARDSRVELTEMRGMRSASWAKGEFEYLLVGGTDADVIAKAARVFSELL
jgi:anti-sigma factor RsiW